MITRIRIKNFRSLVDVNVLLDPLTVLIGRSGTGKSNFVNAIRFLRDSLNSRNMNFDAFGGRNRVVHPNHIKEAISFEVDLTIAGVDGAMKYSVSQNFHGQIEERFAHDDQVLFHQNNQTWVVAPKVTPQPPPGGILLGAIPGLQLSTIAYIALRSGTGCYDFQGNVLKDDGKNDPPDRGYTDDGGNYLRIAERINTDISKLLSWKRISRAMVAVNRSVEALTLDMPNAQRIDVALRAGDQLLTFDIRQESEGFRRFLAHLFAMYQTPSKQTLLFEQPETGLHPGALQALFEEFNACPQDDRGQVVLTTQSPQLLDYFDGSCIRVVEIDKHASKIGPIAPEQIEGLRECLLSPGELLTVDPARLQGQLAEVPA